MSFATGISATKAGFDLVKGLREALGRGEVNPGDIQARLVELQGFLLDAQLALSDGQEDNRHLRAKNEELLRVADFGKDFRFQEGVYWHRGYPYCPNCWDADRKPIRLNGPYNMGRGEPTLWKCSVHDSTFPLWGDGR